MAAVEPSSPELLQAATAYQRWAPAYDRAANPMLALEERLLRPMLPRLQHRTVVDVGCGTGRWLQIAQQAGARSVGVDASPAMLAQAAQKRDIAHRLICGDAAALPIASGVADVVISSFTAAYVADLAGFIAEIARVCKRAGTCFISDMHPAAAARGWRRTFRDAGRSFEIAAHHRPSNDYLDAFHAAGLTLDAFVEASFEEPERPIFAINGKPELFDAIAGVPAIVIYRCISPPAAVRARRNIARTSEFILSGARVALGPQTAVSADVKIANGRVVSVDSLRAESGVENRVDLSGFMLLPGLINAHDHLEFNLFPRLGSGPYRNFTEWAKDIHRPDESPVREHRAVPKQARLRCGGLKNLLCGATTVSHHNEFHAATFTDAFPVRVVRRYGWAHSLALGDVRGAARNTPARWPVIVHAGEGTDAASRAELRAIEEAGVLGSQTVFVHGVAFDHGDLMAIAAAGAALVWCPSSNVFALGTTLELSKLRTLTRIALGSDSAISGAGDLLDEIGFAHAQCSAPPALLYEMVTTRAADVLRLGPRFGRIASRAVADLAVVADRGLTPAETLVGCTFRDIEAVFVGGEARLLSPAMRARCASLAIDGLRALVIDGCTRLVPAVAAEAVRIAAGHLEGAPRIAGKAVTA